MYITVLNRDRTAQYNTKFDCNNCVHFNRCTAANYKTNCAFYDYIRPNFRFISIVPYLTTGQPRLIHINLDFMESVDRAESVIEHAKHSFLARQK